MTRPAEEAPRSDLPCPFEPLATNEASVLRVSLYQTSIAKFKSLIGSLPHQLYLQDDRIRELMLPAQTKLWSSIGPFPCTGRHEGLRDGIRAGEGHKNRAARPEEELHQGRASAPEQGRRRQNRAGRCASEAREGEQGALSRQERSRALGKVATRLAAGDKVGVTAAAAASDGKPPSIKGAAGVDKKPIGAGAGEVAQPEQTGKPGPEAGKESKGNAVAGVVKPGFEPTKEAKGEAKPAAAAAGNTEKQKADAARRKPEKITWAEQLKWRDGTAARLEGANAAYYLTRKIVSTRPRTAIVQIDGPAGFRMWVNGALAQSSLPLPPVVPPKGADAKETTAGKGADGKNDQKTEDDKEEPTVPEINDSNPDESMGRGRNNAAKKFRIGLRQGENEIVVKAVFGAGASPGGRRDVSAGGETGGGPAGGGSCTFNLTPEGDDVLTHEVVTALRLEALKPPAEPHPSAVASASTHDAPSSKTASNSGGVQESGPSNVTTIKHGPNPRDTASSADDRAMSSAKVGVPIKVSLVGEKSAPVKSSTEENKLSPTERRKKVLRDYYRSHIDPVGRIIAEELSKFQDEEKLVKRRLPQTLVMEELEKPRQAFIFKRGLYKARGENVNPATPAVLPPLAKGAPRNRLGLAQWLVSGQHPLTARVVVNRIWQQYFGVGIVRTAEDFGTRGELPTHPELLDHLAAELVDGKWDLKKLHKQIVLSATYRQASTTSKVKLDRDPENRLLARGPRLRLTAEMVRDNALAVSGLLVEKIGGESVKPVQPKNAWKTVEGFMANSYRRHGDERQYRRALYVYWKRGSPYPSLLNFDAVKRDSCTVTRAITTTPVQALTLLNDPAYVECAKMLGQRMLKDREPLRRTRDLKKPEEDAKRLAYGFRLCTSRYPSDQETQILRKLLNDQRAQFKVDVNAAKQLLGAGDAKIDDTLDAAESAVSDMPSPAAHQSRRHDSSLIIGRP